MSSFNYKQVSQQLKQHINYNRSEQLALNNGFEEVSDEKAYNGRYFIKDGRKWIHNISGLKRQLGICDNSKLEELDYDVNMYFLTHS